MHSKKAMTIPERSPEQIREHYEIEIGLAQKLLNSAPDERQAMYSSVYDELFRRVPSHPQLQGKLTPAARQAKIEPLVRSLSRMLSSDMDYMEIGAGDCALALRLAHTARRVVAVDVSAEVMPSECGYANVEFLVGDGRSIPVDSESIDLAFSNQLLEHVHPDDAQLHLSEVRRILKPGGRYFIITPNRVTGPHDISRYFDDVAKGLHLREYCVSDLVTVGRVAGYTRFEPLVFRRGRGYRLPLGFVRMLEGALKFMPSRIARRARRSSHIRSLLGINMVLTR